MQGQSYISFLCVQFCFEFYILPYFIRYTSVFQSPKEIKFTKRKQVEDIDTLPNPLHRFPPKRQSFPPSTEVILNYPITPKELRTINDENNNYNNHENDDNNDNSSSMKSPPPSLLLFNNRKSRTPLMPISQNERNKKQQSYEFLFQEKNRFKSKPVGIPVEVLANEHNKLNNCSAIEILCQDDDVYSDFDGSLSSKSNHSRCSAGDRRGDKRSGRHLFTFSQN